MSDKIIRIHHFSDNSYDSQPAEKCNLSIRITQDGFSFCIHETDHNKYLLLESFKFDIKQSDDNVQYVEESSLLLGHFFKRCKWIQKPFKSVKILYESIHYTLVPFALFDESKKEVYLSFSFNRLEKEKYITQSEYIPALDAYNIYTLPKSLQYTLNNFFPLNIIKHQVSLLVETLLQLDKKGEHPKRIYLNVRPSGFDVILIENDQLVYSNSFEFNAPEDLLYYTLYISQQFLFDPERDQLTLIGQIEKDSDNYNILFEYIKHIEFIERNNNFQYSTVFDNQPSQLYFTLFNLNA